MPLRKRNFAYAPFLPTHALVTSRSPGKAAYGSQAAFPPPSLADSQSYFRSLISGAFPLPPFFFPFRQKNRWCGQLESSVPVGVGLPGGREVLWPRGPRAAPLTCTMVSRGAGWRESEPAGREDSRHRRRRSGGITAGLRRLGCNLGILFLPLLSCQNLEEETGMSRTTISQWCFNLDGALCITDRGNEGTERHKDRPRFRVSDCLSPSHTAVVTLCS